jgi:hypothetical protein
MGIRILIAVEFEDCINLDDAKKSGSEITQSIAEDIPFVKDVIFTTEVAEALNLAAKKLGKADG